jgi:hypothetical protein
MIWTRLILRFTPQLISVLVEQQLGVVHSYLLDPR